MCHVFREWHYAGLTREFSTAHLDYLSCKAFNLEVSYNPSKMSMFLNLFYRITLPSIGIPTNLHYNTLIFQLLIEFRQPKIYFHTHPPIQVDLKHIFTWSKVLNRTNTRQLQPCTVVRGPLKFFPLSNRPIRDSGPLVSIMAVLIAARIVCCPGVG